MPKPLKAQVMVITGASSGIGLATAVTAAQRGAKVVLSARNERDLNAAVDYIRGGGGDAIAVVADVTRQADMERLAHRAIETFGRIDTWVNNAGVAVYAPFRQLPPDDARRIMEVNFFGQLHGARAALPHLEKTGGALICVASALSDRASPFMSLYSASKHAVAGWADALRVELQKAGSPVRITVVKPGSINTPLYHNARTLLGVHPRPVRPVYDPQLAADAILRAATHKVREVFVGGAGKLLSVGERISPSLNDLALRAYMFRAHKTDWPKRSDAPSNLYAPVEHDGGIRGVFLEEAHHRSVYQFLQPRLRLAMMLAGAAAGIALSRRIRARAARR